MKGTTIRSVLRKELCFSFVKAKKVHPQANTSRARVQRQRFALELLRALEKSYRVINIDETWLNELNF